MSLAMQTPCPCQTIITNASQLSYAECCQPLHHAVNVAQTAEQLMRSRYSAFVLQLVDYIVQTTLPTQQPLLDIKAIDDWAKETDWVGLDVVQHVPKIGKRHAQVAFKVYYSTVEGKDTHHELSTFVMAKPKLGRGLPQWYFIDPTVPLNLTQKQPCICGSGEKFKRCCGQFIC